MGHFVQRRWASALGGIGVPRRDRAGGVYFAYIPDELSGLDFVLNGDVAADVADATAAITRLDTEATALTNTEGLARLLLRAESVASSHIEGLSVSPQRLLRADADLAEGLPVTDNTALDVLANVDAMAYAIADPDGEVTVDRILEIHRRLLVQARVAAYAGAIRTEQNWIGGSHFNPLGAHYVPPPAEEVPRLLADLCAFCNSDALPAVAQAAIAHAQFESIHPFADGNGRTGRALIHIVLRRRGLGVHAMPPVSLVLATRAKDYIARLDATRVDGPVPSPNFSVATNSWIAFFAAACVRAVSDAESFEQRVTQIQSEWRARVAGARADSAARALLERLPEAPVITVNAAAKLLGRSFVAANRAVEALVTAKILVPTRLGRRNRTFEAREIINAFNGLERQLASPAGDTRAARPTRAVPARPLSKTLRK